MSGRYRSNDYRFIDKDPIIDVIRTVLQRGGNLSQSQLDRVSYESGVAASTIHSWLFGYVRRPQSLSTRFVLEACGVSISYVDSDGKAVRQSKPDYIPKTEQNKILAKDREREREREKRA